jgi:hypothetical protein
VTLGHAIRKRIPSAKGMLAHGFCRRRKLVLLLLFVSAPAIAQKAMPGKTAAQTTQAAEPSFMYAGAAYEAGNRRDPFLHLPPPPPIKKTIQPAKMEDAEIPRGAPPPGIAGTLIAQAKLEGISEGVDRRIAVVRGAESRAYFLKEGDKLFDGYLKSIRDDSVIFVREVKMKSGKTNTQEIIKRLRTP